MMIILVWQKGTTVTPNYFFFALECSPQNACCCAVLYEQITPYCIVCAASTEFLWRGIATYLPLPGKPVGLNCKATVELSEKEASSVELDHYVNVRTAL